MKNEDNKLNASEMITREMMENEDFCLSVVNCKDRDEVKEFLASQGIDADDNDIDNLAKNISEVADICKKLDDSALDNIVGGAQRDANFWGNFAGTAAKVVGISAIVAGGLMVLTFVGAAIKKHGDEKGWWGKNKK